MTQKKSRKKQENGIAIQRMLQSQPSFQNSGKSSAARDAALLRILIDCENTLGGGNTQLVERFIEERLRLMNLKMAGDGLPNCTLANVMISPPTLIILIK